MAHAMVEHDNGEVERELANGLFAWLQQIDDTLPPPLNSQARDLLGQLSVDRDTLPEMRSLINSLDEKYILPLRIHVSGFDEHVVRQLDGEGVFDDAREALTEACYEAFALPVTVEGVVAVEAPAPSSQEVNTIRDRIDKPAASEKQTKKLRRDPASRRTAFLRELGIARSEDTPEEITERLASFMLELYRQVTQQVSTEGIQRSILVVESFLSGQVQREIAETNGFSTATVSQDRRKLTEDLRYLVHGESLNRLVEAMCDGQSPNEGDMSELLALANERIEARVKLKIDRQLGSQAVNIVARVPQRIDNPVVVDFLRQVTDPRDDELSWQERALCAQTDPESFFPEKGGSTREAKRVCQSCEVRVECLEHALDNDERFGIWGGLSERERRKLKKSNKGELKLQTR